MTAEEHHQRSLRFARIRRIKFWLRFMPRRARFHTYPVVGRFAAFARKRSYLWSLRYDQLRASFYVGSIISLMPAIGIQLPVVFALCLFFRTNFMVAGGLQFLTNPLTLFVVYPVTYKVGERVLHHTGWGPVESIPPVPGTAGLPPVAIATAELHPQDQAAKAEGNWLGVLARKLGVSNLTHLFNALLVGGLICGAALGACLDLLWRRFVLPAAHHRAAHKPVTAQVSPHPTDPVLTSPPPSSDKL